MAKLVLLPIASEIESGTYLVYDGACGTGGMLDEESALIRERCPLPAAGTPSRPRTSSSPPSSLR